MTTEERLIKTKLWINKDKNFPFYGYLLFQLKFVESKSCPTMGVDGEYCYYNPAFVSKLDDPTLRAVLIHEVSHLSLGSIWRRGSRNPFIWNLATDFVINLMIHDLKNPNIKLSKGFLLDTKYKNWAAEQVYEDLKKRVKIININVGNKFCKDANGNPIRGDHDVWGNKKISKAKQKKLQNKWKRATQQAADIHRQKQKGNLPWGIERMVEELQPKVDWKEVLMSYAVSDNSDYSYRRPDKRFLNGDFILPDLVEGEKLEDIVIGVDTSGSISEQELNRFAGEIKGILKSFDKIKAYICSLDTQVYNWQEISDSEIKIRYAGGGGTDYRCLFHEIAKRKIEPKVVLIFGDMYADFPSQKPDYDVIWLAPRRDRGNPPKWGRLLTYE